MRRDAIRMQIVSPVGWLWPAVRGLAACHQSDIYAHCWLQDIDILAWMKWMWFIYCKITSDHSKIRLVLMIKSEQGLVCWLFNNKHTNWHKSCHCWSLRTAHKLLYSDIHCGDVAHSYNNLCTGLIDQCFPSIRSAAHRDAHLLDNYSW